MWWHVSGAAQAAAAAPGHYEACKEAGQAKPAVRQIELVSIDLQGMGETAKVLSARTNSATDQHHINISPQPCKQCTPTLCKSWLLSSQDLPRTFPRHTWLSTPEGQTALRDVLTAYAGHNPDVGYCQVCREGQLQGMQRAVP